MSLFVVTAVLAVSGFGLFMYKFSDSENSLDYKEDELFKESFWSLWSKNEEETNEHDTQYELKTKNNKEENENEEKIPKLKDEKVDKKTKRNKKNSTSKRRY